MSVSVPVLGARSHIILIGTGSMASAHQTKLSQMVSLLNTQVHLEILEIQYFTFFVYPLNVFFLVVSFCPHITQSHRSMSSQSMSEWRGLHADPTQTLV